MASGSNKSGKTASGRPGNSTRRNSAGNSSYRSRSRKATKKASVFEILKESSAGRGFLLLLIAVILIGFDFLFSLNQFDIFFLLLGIEIVISVLLGWLRFVLRGRVADSN